LAADLNMNPNETPKPGGALEYASGASAVETASIEPIPTPMKLRLRRIRYQILPIVVFTLALCATAYLWKDYAGTPHGVGEVNAVTVRVAAPHDGKLAAMEGYPRVYDHVDLGQPIARFDVTHLQDQQDKAQEELSKLQKELDDANKLVETAGKGSDKSKLEDAKRQAAAYKGALEEKRTEFDHLERQIKAATIESPVGGKVTAVDRQPNEFVKQGQEIMTITQDSGAYIVSYVRPGSAVMPRKDMKVLVRNQTSRKSAWSRVQEVGTSVQPIPEHQLTNSKKPEWGIPVRIAMPDTDLLPLRPGELVVLNFQSDQAK
jgi:multidrug resistance efflux pump